jgi:hypothetical protein
VPRPEWLPGCSTGASISPVTLSPPGGQHVAVPRRGTRTVLAITGIAVVALLGLAFALASAGRARTELNRGPTAAERSAAASEAVALRWRSWRAGRIFPAGLVYTAPDHPAGHALRVGIAARSGCSAGLDAVAARAAASAGCRAVLRASYTDQLRGVVFTVGVAVFPAPRGAAAFLRRLAGPALLHGSPGYPAGAGHAGTASPGGAGTAVLSGYLRNLPAAGPGSGGVRALALPGTAAALFTDPARQTVSGWQDGPYVVLATAGYADGRPAMATAEPRHTVFWPAPQLAADVLRPLTTPPHVTCGQPGWRC